METREIIGWLLMGISSLIVLLAPLLNRYPKFQLNLRYVAVAFTISLGDKLATAYLGLPWWISFFIPIAYIAILYYISRQLAPFIIRLSQRLS